MQLGLAEREMQGSLVGLRPDDGGYYPGRRGRRPVLRGAPDAHGRTVGGGQDVPGDGPEQQVRDRAAATTSDHDQTGPRGEPHERPPGRGDDNATAYRHVGV